MRLVTVAHGTRSASGNAVAVTLTALAGARLGLPAVATFVELAQPRYADVVGSPAPSVVVALLLSTGHHVRHDLGWRGGLGGHGGRGGLGPLGPHPLLADAQVSRLLAAGATPGRPVVMVAAGSRDPEATADLQVAAGHLAAAWGGEVRLATLAGPGRRPAEVVRPGDAVSPYLLAPGHFADRCRTECLGALTADVIGPHPAVVELVVRRAVDALASSALACPSRVSRSHETRECAESGGSGRVRDLSGSR